MCGPSAKVAWPQLLEVLQGTDLNLKVLARGTLGNLGPNAVAAVPALRQLANQPGNESWRREITEALELIE